MRVALNQATFETADTSTFLAAAAAAGVTDVALWRHKLDGSDLSGFDVFGLCRGGFFTTPGGVEDTRVAIEQAAAVDCPLLVLVCGGAADGDLVGARDQIARGIEAVLPVADEHGVQLAIEPFHPVFAADRSAIVTLDQACEMAERFDIGVAVDTFHVWWDPGLDRAIARASGRILSLQVADWPAEMGVPLRGRVLPGDGVAPLGKIVAAVAATGYDGPVEVEVLGEDVWARDPFEIARLAVERTEALLGVRS